MRTWNRLFLSVILIGALTGAAAAQSQPQQTADRSQAQSNQPASGSVLTVNQAINRIIAREHEEVAAIRRYEPIIETYIQEMKPDQKLGLVPDGDHYFLGQADLAKGVIDNSMLTEDKNSLGKYNPLSHIAGFFSSSYNPAGFLQMIYVDTTGFDRQHYRFDYVGKAFLGSVRCLVFDVTPLPNSGRGRFKGRIWVEDKGFTIVRFNGAYTPTGGTNGFKVHFDSWRMNMQPGVWLPAFIYSQESDEKDLWGNHIRFQAQTHLWGYDLKSASREQEFSQLTIESPTAIQGQSAADQDRSPLEAERQWQHEAEMNVVDRLQRVGLLAPPSPVDKVLETVVNNLEVTNNLDIQPEVHCRVLLTSTLESFTIGHTIVLSRGLIDVLPDEASLATVLAQDLADILVAKPSMDQWGFDDTTQVSAVEALSRFSFRDTPAEIQATGAKALAMLKKSPYKNKLGSAALFLKQLRAEEKVLPALINPRIGNGVYINAQLSDSGPQLQPAKLDQIAALPLGARLKVDPWSDRVDLLKSKPAPLYSARDKMPFEITPFMPFLARYQRPGTVVSGGDAASKQDMANKEQQPAQQP